MWGLHEGELVLYVGSLGVMPSWKASLSSRQGMNYDDPVPLASILSNQREPVGL